MIIRSLTLKNIRSYKDASLLFPKGAVLLAGDVGAGKTTLLLAIEYALFGLQPGQRGSALLRNDASEGEVSLTCKVGEQEILIERSLKRDTKGVSNEYAALTIDGRKEECSITELKTKILSILGYPEEFIKKNNILYKYTIYTPQEHMRQIITEDPETRLSILRHIFGINKYKRIRENLAFCIVSFKEEVKAKQIEIKLLENQEKALEEKKKEQRALDEKIQQLTRVLNEKKAIHQETERELQEMSAKQREREKFEKEIEKATLLVATKKEALQTSIRERKRMQQLLTNASPFDHKKYELSLRQLIESKATEELLSSKLLTCKAECAALETQRKQQGERREKVFNLNHCPTCLQDVPLTHKHNIVNEVESLVVSLTKRIADSSALKKEIEEALQKQKIISKCLEEEKQKADLARSKEVYLAESRVKEQELQKTEELLTKDVSFLTEHLFQLRETTAEFTKFSMLSLKKETELKQTLREERVAEVACAESVKEASLLIKEMQRIEKEILKRKELEIEMQRKSGIVDWLTGPFSTLVETTERQVLLNIRREFSKLLQQWFYSIAGEGFSLELDEHFTPLILHKGIEMEYAFLSGGERTALALAYRLALTTVINSLISAINTREIVILDEPTDGFSDYQIDKMREVLKEVACKQLIIVSHEQKMEGFVDHIIRITKEHGASHIVKEEKDLPQVLNTAQTDKNQNEVLPFS
ncbi:hypothetical protein FJZ22_01295 [Candidatus Pacearchaeota archaeon]|nr:hypothetical protein [Candidatus Pacearchaeota archaeon]